MIKRLLIVALVVIVFISGLSMCNNCNRSSNEETESEEVSFVETAERKAKYKEGLAAVEKGYLRSAFEIAQDLRDYNASSADSIISKIKTTKSINWETIDADIAALKKSFTKKHDEFKGVTFYTPSAEVNNYHSTVYAYFSVSDAGSLSSPRLVIQYYGDDWIFWETVDFLIDGQLHSFTPAKVEKENNSEVWESSDDTVEGHLLDIVQKMESGKSVKCRLNGQQYYKDLKLSSKQLLRLKQTMLLHRLIDAKKIKELIK